MRKPYKIIEINETKISLIGNHHWKEIKYKINPDTSYENLEGYFTYLGNDCYIADYMRIDSNNPFYDEGFDGYKNDSFFSGELIKFADSWEAVQITTFIAS